MFCCLSLNKLSVVRPYFTSNKVCLIVHGQVCKARNAFGESHNLGYAFLEVLYDGRSENALSIGIGDVKLTLRYNSGHRVGLLLKHKMISDVMQLLKHCFAECIRLDMHDLFLGDTIP